MSEVELVQRVELRILTTNSDESLSKALDLFLCPLLLKLASPNAQVSARVQSLLNHINIRLNPNVVLPQSKLIDQLLSDTKESVKLVSALYIYRSFKTQPCPLELVFSLVNGISQNQLYLKSARLELFFTALNQFDPKTTKFELLLPRADWYVLCNALTHLFLLDLKYRERGSCPGLNSQEFTEVAGSHGLEEKTLSKTKISIIHLLSKCVELVVDRPAPENDEMDHDAPVKPSPVYLWMPLFIAKSDRLDDVSTTAHRLFKRLDLDTSYSMAVKLIELALGSQGRSPVKPNLRIKILDLLATTSLEFKNELDPFKIVDLCISTGELKQIDSAIRFLRAVLAKARVKGIACPLQNADAYAKRLEDYITSSGWPLADSNNSTAQNLRQKAYETMGIFLSVVSPFPLRQFKFLLQSLERDTITMVPSVQQALSELLRPASNLYSDAKAEMEKLLFDFNLSASRDASKYIAVRFANRALPFSSTVARTICLLNIDPSTRSDVVDAAKRGLHPVDFVSENSILGETIQVKFPSFEEMLNHIVVHKQYLCPQSFDLATLFIYECLISQAVQLSPDKDWTTSFWVAVEMDSSTRQQIREYFATGPPLDAFMDLCFSNLTNDAFASAGIPENILRVWKNILGLEPRSLLIEQVQYSKGLINLLSSHEALATTAAESLAILSTTEPGKQIPSQILAKGGSFAPIALAHVLSRQSLYGLQVDRAVVAKCVAEFQTNKNPDIIYQLAISGILEVTPELPEQLIHQNSEKSLLALGSLAIPDPTNTEKFLSLLLKPLSTKSVDILLANGEAISICCSGWNSSALNQELRPDSVPNSNAQLINTALESAFKGAKNSDPNARRCACVRLLCMVQYSKQDIMGRLGEIQLCFMRFLADPDDVSQESATRGLSIVYDASDASTKSELVENLVASFTSDQAAKKAMSGMVTADTQLFEPGVLTTNDGSVSTYKDVLNLASEVGDASLVYRFMSLASSSSIWSSRRGMAFGLEQILNKASLDENLNKNSKLGKNLIPKMFRYRFDPNPRAQTVMRSIWDSIVKDRVQTVRDHFEDIMKELLQSCTDREWRVREAGSTGLASVVEVEQWKTLEPYIEELWNVGFRLMDDIKESVRTSGLNLTKALSALLVRRLEGGYTTNDKLLAHLLPFLLSHKGLESQSEDIRKFSLDTLSRIARTNTPQLAPFILDFLGEFVKLLSTLEPQLMNYLALNSANLGVDATQVDQHRIRELQHSPMMETLETLIGNMTSEQLNAVVAALPGIVKASVGLPSLAGAARVVVLTCIRFPREADFGPLLKMCEAQLSDKNDIVSQSFAMACGYVCRLAPLKNVVLYIDKLKQRLLSEDDDIKPKLVVGDALKCLSRYASDVFGSLAKSILPLIFLAQFYPDEDVSKRFKAIWDENTGGRGTVELYSSEILDLCVPLTTAHSWNLRVAAAKAIAQAASVVTRRDDEKITALLVSLTGRSWPGKEYLVQALVSLVSSQTDGLESVCERLIAEMSRRNDAYKLKLLGPIGEYVEAHYDQRLADIFYAFVEKAVTDNVTVDEGIEDDTKIEALEAAVKAYSFGNTSKETMDKIVLPMFKGWKFKIAACHAMAKLGEKQHFSADLWRLSLDVCANDVSHENVRLAWAQSACALKDFGVKEDVDACTRHESSMQVLAELKKGGFR